MLANQHRAALLRGVFLLCSASALTGTAFGQEAAARPGISNNPVPPQTPEFLPVRELGNPSQRAEFLGACTQNCNVIDFEGLGDTATIGTIVGTPDVTFGPSWLSVIDADAGGSGNFANEPSDSTIAFFLTAVDPIDFSEPVNFVEILYVASSISSPVTLTAYDGPGGTGNVVDVAIGATVGTDFDGAPCDGDPNGQFCLWDTLTLSSDTNSIRSLVLSGSVANQFAFDNMSFCTTGDSDGDALLDDWEICGIDFDQDGTIDLDLPAMGADPNVPDIFVEVDSMSGRAPSSLNGVVAAFAAQGITLHIQNDETNIPLAAWPDAWAGFDAVKASRFGTPAERASANWANIRAAKRLSFRYCVFADQYGGSGSSGLAEIGGDDFMVTLGHPSWTTPGGTPDQQSGTFMHELGHALGLRHGGADNIKWKPNYRSVMNYAWQLPRSWSSSQWGLFYSGNVLNTLNESNLDETAGIGGALGNIALAGPLPARIVTESGAVDWNRDGDKSDMNEAEDVSFVVTGAASPGQTLIGHNDWAALKYNFRDTTDFAPGVHLNLPEEEHDGDTEQLLEAACPEPATYCTAKVNSLGCTPSIGFSGMPTLTGADDFFITASNVVAERWGVMFWGLSEAAMPFAGGTMCIDQALVRGAAQWSGGTAGTCDGTYSTDFSQAYMNAQGLLAGDTVYAQYISRDNGFAFPDNLGLTNALVFVICP